MLYYLHLSFAIDPLFFLSFIMEAFVETHTETTSAFPQLLSVTTGDNTRFKVVMDALLNLNHSH
jgi:hypothetical protein